MRRGLLVWLKALDHPVFRSLTITESVQKTIVFFTTDFSTEIEQIRYDTTETDKDGNYPPKGGIISVMILKWGETACLLLVSYKPYMTL